MPPIAFNHQRRGGGDGELAKMARDYLRLKLFPKSSGSSHEKLCRQTNHHLRRLQFISSSIGNYETLRIISGNSQKKKMEKFNSILRLFLLPCPVFVEIPSLSCPSSFPPGKDHELRKLALLAISLHLNYSLLLNWLRRGGGRKVEPSLVAHSLNCHRTNREASCDCSLV